MEYRWSDGNGHEGVEASMEEALRELGRHVRWIEEAWTAPSCDGSTTYFYASEEERDADQEGAYAPQITETE